MRFLILLTIVGLALSCRTRSGDDSELQSSRTFQRLTGKVSESRTNKKKIFITFDKTGKKRSLLMDKELTPSGNPPKRKMTVLKVASSFRPDFKRGNNSNLEFNAKWPCANVEKYAALRSTSTNEKCYIKFFISKYDPNNPRKPVTFTLLALISKNKDDKYVNLDKNTPHNYPYVDMNATDGNIIPYTAKPVDYMRFTGHQLDIAKSIFKKIQGKTIQSQPLAIQEQYLNKSTNPRLNKLLVPIKLPRKTILRELRKFSKNHWRYFPGGDFHKLSTAEKGRNLQLYGHVDTYPDGHVDKNNFKGKSLPIIYSFDDCVNFASGSSHWSALQKHYFCMVPGAFRGCYRSNVSNLDVIDKWKNKPAIMQAVMTGTDRRKAPLREVVLARCLTLKADPNNAKHLAFFDRMIKHSTIAKTMGVSTGKQWIREFKPTGNLERRLFGFSRRALSVGTPPRGMSQAQRELKVADDLRDFYTTQYFKDKSGKEYNLYDYIMFAPTLQFDFMDERAILNSYYHTMSAVDPLTGKAFWPKDDANYYFDKHCRGTSTAVRPRRGQPRISHCKAKGFTYSTIIFGVQR